MIRQQQGLCPTAAGQSVPECRVLPVGRRETGADRTIAVHGVRSFDPPAWISTDDLEDDLFNAIMEDSTCSCEDDEAFDETEVVLDDDDFEDEDEPRRGTLRLLSTMRPGSLGLDAEALYGIDHLRIEPFPFTQQEGSEMKMRTDTAARRAIEPRDPVLSASISTRL